MLDPRVVVPLSVAPCRVGDPLNTTLPDDPVLVVTPVPPCATCKVPDVILVAFKVANDEPFPENAVAVTVPLTSNALVAVLPIPTLPLLLILIPLESPLQGAITNPPVGPATPLLPPNTIPISPLDVIELYAPTLKFVCIQTELLFVLFDTFVINNEAFGVGILSILFIYI
jgi:hypothetical protein